MADFRGNNGGDTLIVVPGTNSYDGLGGTDTLDFPETPFQHAMVAKTGPLSGTVTIGGDVSTFANIENLGFFDGRLTFDINDRDAQIFRLYETAFDRAPDQPGFESWTNLLDGTFSLKQIADFFITSPEGTARFGNLDNTAFVTELYQDVLGRSATPGEINGWVNLLAQPGETRGDVLVGFSESQEHVNLTAPAVQAGLWDNDRDIINISIAYHTGLGRAPDLDGAHAWAAFLDIANASLHDLTDAFAAVPEFRDHHRGQDNATFVTQLYEEGLGRTPSQAEVNSWVSLLDSGTSRELVYFDFVSSQEALAHAYAQATHGITFA